MILIDTNLWLYATLRELPQHERARQWLESTINGDEPIALPWSVLLGVVRISTQARLMRQPLTPAEALDLVEGWLQQPLVQLVVPGPDHWSLLRQLLHAVGSAGNLTPDAHLAALAISSDSLLCSADNDFRRFPGLRFLNPLA
ncbi:MAG: type II toxin-antitoxin system VapC family toxin [Synechococcaceae cyanobacterium ELA445]